MTKAELIDTHWHDYLVWCATFDNKQKDSHLVFWLDHNAPCEDNFWEWIVKYKAEALGEKK